VLLALALACWYAEAYGYVEQHFWSITPSGELFSGPWT
jgi:hypothetical protein